MDDLEADVIRLADKIHSEKTDNIDHTLDAVHGAQDVSLKEEQISKPESIVSLLETHFEDPHYIYPEVLCEGSTICYGKPKSGKSDFMLGLTMRYTMGLPLLGKKTQGGGALFFGLEDGRPRLKRRIMEYINRWRPNDEQLDLFRRRMHYHIFSPTIDNGLTAYVLDYIKENPDIRLIVFDMYKKIDSSRPDGNTYKSEARVGHEMTKFCNENPGIAAVVTHHARKVSAGNPVDAVLGTGGLVGSFDNIIHLEVTDDDVRIMHVGGRDIEPDEYYLESVDKKYTFEVIDQDDVVSKRKRVWTAIPQTSSVCRDDIAAAADVDGRTLTMHLKQLCEDGLVEKPKHGRYVRTEKWFFEREQNVKY